ncbi:MAG: hypothetical protein N3A54_03295 [Patescibacteria group bacterium]|nr:hypothetical protein [Patescibacteria group bacterium]
MTTTAVLSELPETETIFEVQYGQKIQDQIVFIEDLEYFLETKSQKNSFEITVGISGLGYYYEDDGYDFYDLYDENCAKPKKPQIIYDEEESMLEENLKIIFKNNTITIITKNFTDLPDQTIQIPQENKEQIIQLSEYYILLISPQTIQLHEAILF